MSPNVPRLRGAGQEGTEPRPFPGVAFYD